MTPKGVGLLTASVTVGTAPAFVGPIVPWWGQLIMAIISAALAFFGGRAEAARRGR